MLIDFFGKSASSLSIIFVKAWIERDKNIRKMFYILIPSFLTGLPITILSENKTFENPIFRIIGIVLLIITFLSVVTITAYQTLKDEQLVEKEIKAKEEDLKANPDDSQTAWDLARIKLESYLNRNINQVKWIFIWTIIVMFAGFGMISFGIYKVYESPLNFQPSILVTVAGIVTEFIAVTFLIIYKSTMTQAKDYVNVLERINAVGMSIQVLETLSKESDILKDNTKAELAKELLKLYGNRISNDKQ